MCTPPREASAGRETRTQSHPCDPSFPGRPKEKEHNLSSFSQVNYIFSDLKYPFMGIICYLCLCGVVSPIAVELREQVLCDGCERTPSGWCFSGVVKDPGGSSELLLITVFFADEHTTVSDFAQTTAQVGTGTQVGMKIQVRWGAEESCGTTPTTRCVLTGAGKRVRQPGASKGFCRLGVHRDGSVRS